MTCGMESASPGARTGLGDYTPTQKHRCRDEFKKKAGKSASPKPSSYLPELHDQVHQG